MDEARVSEGGVGAVRGSGRRTVMGGQLQRSVLERAPWGSQHSVSHPSPIATQVLVIPCPERPCLFSVG